MSVLEFIDSTVFTPAYDNDVPLVRSDNVDAICRELRSAILNNETIMLYGDYDMDGLCCMMAWKEVLSLLRAKPPVMFNYIAKTHRIDHSLIVQAEAADAKVVIICDTGSSGEDRFVLDALIRDGRTPIVIDHHIHDGPYDIYSKHYLMFNAYEERNILGGADVSGAYACVLVAKVLCEKFMNAALSHNAKVYALASMYSDVVDMSSPIARALYSAVAMANAPGPDFFVAMNEWKYLYGRRFFSFMVAPKLNGCFRMERMTLLNDITHCTDKRGYKKICEELAQIHSDARKLVKSFVGLYERERLGDIVLCVHEVNEETRSLNIRNFTGVVATMIAQEEKAPVICVVKDSGQYSGSYRDYYNRGLIDSFSLFARCGGHPSAFGLTFYDLQDFRRRCTILSRHVTETVERPNIVLNSGVIEKKEDFDALALFNEFANVKKSVIVSHSCKKVELIRSTKYSKYYDVGFAEGMQVMTKRPIAPGATIWVEPAICRGVELREVE